MGLDFMCVQPRVATQRCPYDHADVTPDAPRRTCGGCGACHDRECWQALGRCGACGWKQELAIVVRPVRTSLHVPPTRSCLDCRRPRSGSGLRRLLEHLEAEHDVCRLSVARELEVSPAPLRAYEGRPDGGLPGAFRERLVRWLDELEDFELEEEHDLEEEIELEER